MTADPRGAARAALDALTDEQYFGYPRDRPRDPQRLSHSCYVPEGAARERRRQEGYDHRCPYYVHSVDARTLRRWGGIDVPITQDWYRQPFPTAILCHFPDFAGGYPPDSPERVFRDYPGLTRPRPGERVTPLDSWTVDPAEFTNLEHGYLVMLMPVEAYVALPTEERMSVIVSVSAYAAQLAQEATAIMTQRCGKCGRLPSAALREATAKMMTSRDAMQRVAVMAKNVSVHDGDFIARPWIPRTRVRTCWTEHDYRRGTPVEDRHDAWD